MIDSSGFNKTTQKIIEIAAVIGAITVIIGGYSFYINNFWKPKVQIVSVDFTKGTAEVKVGTSVIDIYGDALFQVSSGGNWGIKFGSTNGVYDSLELTKNGMVVEYLKR